MIDSFMGENRWLSNFPDAPLFYGGRHFRNSESAYHATKFIEDAQANISPWQFETTSGSEAKKLAKENKTFIRSDWMDISLLTMVEITHAKYNQNKDLRIRLVNTFPHDLVEGNNWHDAFYGVCSCKGPSLCFKGKGMNWLGRILMAERMYWLDLMSHKSWEKSWGTYAQNHLQVVGAATAAA
jgi:ribA/ribD-fused uncharacterized protein